MDGWPFLVARGRRAGYTVLLAPDFLIGHHGFLEDVTGSGPRIVDTTVDGRRLTVVWSEHTVTGSEVHTDDDPRDEHSRPLHLLYGFVCQGGTVTRPSDEDTARSLRTALDTYRRFLADEERFTTESSGPFPLHAGALPRARSAPPAARRRVVPVVLAGLVAVVTIVIIALTSLGGGQPDPGPPSFERPTTTTATTATERR